MDWIKQPWATWTALVVRIILGVLLIALIFQLGSIFGILFSITTAVFLILGIFTRMGAILALLYGVFFFLLAYSISTVRTPADVAPDIVLWTAYILPIIIVTLSIFILILGYGRYGLDKKLQGKKIKIF